MPTENAGCTSGRPPIPFFKPTANHGKRTWVSAVKSECIVHYAMCTCALYIKSVRKQHLIQLFSGGYVDRENFDYGEF